LQEKQKKGHMTHEDAIEKSREYLHLVDKAFINIINSNNEKETIKAVVAWEEEPGNWQPHVCFYNWPETQQGDMSHVNVNEFLRTYKPH
jgi:hypothetical protein